MSLLVPLAMPDPIIMPWELYLVELPAAILLWSVSVADGLFCDRSKLGVKKSDMACLKK